jgi:hypothetical protein
MRDKSQFRKAGELSNGKRWTEKNDRQLQRTLGNFREGVRRQAHPGHANDQEDLGGYQETQTSQEEIASIFFDQRKSASVRRGRFFI